MSKESESLLEYIRTGRKADKLDRLSRRSPELSIRGREIRLDGWESDDPATRTAQVAADRARRRASGDQSLSDADIAEALRLASDGVPATIIAEVMMIGHADLYREIGELVTSLRASAAASLVSCAAKVAADTEHKDWIQAVKWLATTVHHAPTDAVGEDRVVAPAKVDLTAAGLDARQRKALREIYDRAKLLDSPGTQRHRPGNGDKDFED